VTDAATRSVTGGTAGSVAGGGDASKTGPARLDIEDLVVAYGGLRAVSGASLAVEAGAIVGLIGANGSGKTTLLDAVSGLVSPSEGRLLLDHVDMADYRPEERARLGMVRSFQDCRLYPELTVEDTLMLCEDARRPVNVLSSTLQMPWARRAEREKRAAIDGVIASFGLERFRLHQTAHLSTGTRRVVDLASIVLANPRLLLLDEPTAGIAQREAEAFIPLLQRLHQVTDSTILLVEHDVPLVFELCSTVVVMQTGEVVSVGTPDEVKRDPKALAAYLGASDEALNVSGPLAASSAASADPNPSGPNPSDPNSAGPNSAGPNSAGPDPSDPDPSGEAR
jgi:ABC-type branched-subunit amino acid transport system ATPase component